MSYEIGDDNYQNQLGDGDTVFAGGETRFLNGLLPRSEGVKKGEVPEYGAIPGVATADAKIVRIPMESWPDLIADQERNQSSLWHLWKDSPIGVLDQDGLSYCHAFSADDATMLIRWIMGLPYVELSAGSIGGPVTGYRNRGAYIIDDLHQVVNKGVASTEFVPMRQVSKSGWKPGAEENAALHKATEFWDGQPRDFELQGSALFAGFPTCDGYDWWGHAVTGLRIRDLNNGRKATDHLRYSKTILNSWGKSYGYDGCGDLTGSKKIADEWYVFRQATASPK